MSKQVDERVVSMQFDNKNFEKNVSHTMSTLDKFKQKLNLSGASKGLENVNAAAKKVDMKGLADGVETVRVKFSALQVMGVTALSNLTNSAVNAGKKIVAALTIDPIKTGFQEYETQIGAVQTILANTESKGSTLDDVNEALEQLNKYADQTIYNFTEMTRNIGTFTAAGVELDTSVSAIKGIANLAAVSGSTSQQASTAMYQLSQALAAGRVSLMDWNSVVNAGMGGQVFQDALVRTSEVMGTGAKAAIEANGSFRESLTKGEWLTTDVLTETLNQFTLAAEEGTEEWENYKKSLKDKGYTEEQALEILKMANTATDAATKVKTFTQMWDVLKESAQSGWSQTWKLIIGDFEEAKALFTPLTNFLTGMIQTASDFRNKVVELVMGNPLSVLVKEISGMISTTKDIIKPLEDYSDIVRRIIRGEFGNQGDHGDPNYRKKLVEAAGYDYAHAQNLVNEQLGCSVRHTSAYTEALKNQGKAQTNVVEMDEKRLEQLVEMSDAELKALGYSESQIDALRKLAKYAKEAGMSIGDFIKSINEGLTGREMLIKTFENAGKGLVTIFGSIKEAWKDVFPVTAESIAMKIYGAIAKLYELSKSWDISKDTETIDKLKRSFKGLFSLFKVIGTLIGGPIKIAFKLLSQLFGALDINILDVTAVIGDALVTFSNWVEKSLDFTAVFELIAPYIKSAAKAVGEWIDKTKPLEKAGEMFIKLGTAIEKAFVKLKNSEFGKVAQNMIAGLTNGLKDGASTVGQTIWNIGKAIIDKIKEVLGIHSPSTEFIEIGKNIIAGLLVGLTAFKVFDIISKIMNVVGGLGDTLSGVGEVLQGVGTVLVKSAGAIRKILKNTAKVVRSFAKTVGSVGNLINAKALKTVAIAIAILAGSIVVLSLLDPGKMWSAVGVIVVLAGVLGALMIAISKFGIGAPTGIKEAITGVKAFGQLAGAMLMISGSLLLLAISLRIIGGMEWKEFGVAAAGIALIGGVLAGLMVMTKYTGKTLYMVQQTILSLAGAMLMLAVALRIIGKMDWDEFGVAAAGIALLGGMVVGLMAATKLLGYSAGTIGPTLLAVAGAIAILALSMRILGGMDWNQFGVAAAGITLLGGIVAALIYVVKLAGPNVAKIGATILGVAGAMAILTITAKIIAGMEWDEIGRAAVGLVGLILIVRMMIQAVKLAGPNVAAIGATLLAVSGAMAILTIVAKIIAGMEWGEIAKAAIGLAGLVMIIRMMIQAVKLAGTDAPKIALTLLAVSAAIGILAGIAVLLSLVETGALIKGVAAVTVLGAIMALMIKATSGAQDCMKNIVAMTVAIAVMAAAVIALSFIDPTKLAGATIAMGILMGMFGVMTLAAKNANGALGPLIVMAAAIALLAGAVYLLAQLPVDSVIGSAAGLSILLLALAASLSILSTVGNFGMQALVGVGLLLLIAVPLLAFVGILALMQNIQSAEKNVLVLVSMAAALTLLLLPLVIVGALGYPALIGVGLLLLMAVPLLAFVGILALMQNIQNAQQNVNILITLMTTLTACLVSIALVAPLAIIAVTALAILTSVIVAFGVLVVAVGDLVTRFPQLETFIDVGMPLLEKLAQGLGSVLGSFVAGFAVSAMSSLPAIGLLLSQFMVNATPFIIGTKMIDTKAMEGVKALAEVILILTAADILDGLTSWLTGGSSIADFGADIAAFGPSIRAFADSVAGIDSESVQAAANAAKALAEMTATIPNEGGVVGWFAGENSISKFAAELPMLGLGLVQFADVVKGIDSEAVKAGAEAGKAITEMTDTIPNEGGVAAWFAGENSISKFAADLPALGLGIAGFSKAVSGINTDGISSAVTAAQAIVDMSKTIPNQGGVAAWFAGDNSIATFSDELGKFGKGIANLANNVADVKIENVNKAVNATKALTKMLDSDITKKTKAMKDFGEKIVDFGKKLAEFAKKMDGVKDSAINSAVDKFKKIVNMASTLSSDKVSSLKKFSEALADVAKKGIAEFVKALNSKSVKTDANKAVSDVVSSAADSIKTVTNKQKFISAGKYLVEGLTEGIRNNKSKATKAAQEVADAVESIMRAAWEVNSPSKLFYRIALGVGEGIEYAFSDSTAGVTSSARDLADTTSKGFGNAISQIYDYMNSDMNMQPTIRPVLDLSDVQSGANSIAGLFSGNRTLAVSAPGVGAISASMANRQNGNNDLASAINKLAKSNGKSGNTYNINGVSYSEGSDVADAIQTLTRALTIEGRT